MNQGNPDLPDAKVFRLDHCVIYVCDPEPEPPAPDPPRTYDEARVRELLGLTPLVQRVLRRSKVAPADVPDLCQNVLVDLLQWWAGQTRAPIVAVRAYVAVMARRAAYRYHQRRKHRRRGQTGLPDREVLASNEQEAPPDPTEPSPEEAALEAEARAELAAEVNLDALGAATAPPLWRAFYGYEVLGVAVEVIAEAEHVPVGTIYNRVRLARQDLRASLHRRRAARRR